jgi:hypothetical protein
LEVGSEYVVRLSKGKSPLASPFDSAQGMLFQRGVILWDSEELSDAAKRFPPFKKGGLRGIFIPRRRAVIALNT